MAEYLRPDVYVEELNDGEKPIQGVSTSVGALIGITARGVANEPTLVTSWTDFVKKFANGLESPFMRTSDLAHSVFGFFQNGGTKCYVTRVGSTGMAKATATLGESESVLTLTALDEGDWANTKLVVEITANEDEPLKFDITVKYNNAIVEIFEAISNDPENDNFFDYVVNGMSKFITIPQDATLKVGTLNFTGGAYDVTKVTPDLVTGALAYLDAVKVNMVAIPGYTTKTVQDALINYCTNRGDCFAIVDIDKHKPDKDQLVALKKALAEGNGACYYPWGKITDPLAKNTRILRDCPPSGHIMGVYARTDAERGVHKAPAGEEATIKGFVALTDTLTEKDVEALNPNAINCILAKPNKGIIIWGARTLVKDIKKRYVSDIRYDMYIKGSIYEGLQWAVFEPNGDQLWSKTEDTIKAFLDSEWRKGALLGTTSEQAYFVKCDEELNTTDSMEQGFLISDLGYAKKKPAEFVLARISQKQQTN